MKLVFLVLHIASGFVGMFGGLVPLFVRKGGAGHRRWGRVFTWAMFVASGTAFPLAYLSGSAFQAGVGLLAGYAARLGLRSGRKREPALRRDAVIACLGGVGFLALLAYAPFADAPTGRAALVFGTFGLGLAARDLYGQRRRDFSLRRRVVDHILATSLALIVAWSSFLNTQLPRLTGLRWEIDAKMLLPLAVALPLLGYWLPRWSQRVEDEGVRAWTGGRETSELERLRSFGIAEGISFLLLLFVAVPLKHFGGNPTMVKVMGLIHGALSVLYGTSVLLAARPLGWRWPRVLAAFGAGVLPFGTFVLDARLKAEKS